MLDNREMPLIRISEKIPPSPSSTLSDLPVGPPAKRRRVASYSSSVTADEGNSDEDDQPLASRLVRPTAGQKSSKTNGGPHETSKGPHKHPKPLVPQVAGKPSASKSLKSAVSDTPDVKVKMEDTMEEGQLDSLATGVTMDASASGSAVGSVLAKSVYLRARADVAALAFRQTRQTFGGRAEAGCNQDHSRRERWATRFHDPLNQSQDAVSKAATSHAPRIHHTTRL